MSPVVTGETQGDQFLFGENIIVATDNNNEQVEMDNTFKYYIKKKIEILIEMDITPLKNTLDMYKSTSNCPGATPL